MSASPPSDTGFSRFKFGAHQFLWRSHWTDASLSILDTARQLGCALFEVSLGDDVRFDRAGLRRHAESLGIELTVGPGNLWPAECNISADEPQHRQLGLAWHKRTIEQAAELGATAYCGAIYSHPGHVCRRPPPADELPRTAENLRVLAEFADGLNLRLVIEPMSRFRNHLINTSAQAVNLLQLAAHPNLRINLDTYHMITEERDYGAAIRRTLPVLWGIHACENDRGIPGGGLVPWSAVFTALGAALPLPGGEGRGEGGRSLKPMDRTEAGISRKIPDQAPGCIRLMLETYNTGPDGFGYSRGVFQNLCPDPEQFVRQGLDFLHQCVRKSREGQHG